MTTPNTTPLTYNGYVSQIATLAIYQTTTVNGVVTLTSGSPSDAAFFTNLIPQMLNYAELRIQRDLDLLALETTKTGYTTTIGSKSVQIPIDDFVTIQTISYTSNTTKSPLLPVSKVYIQNVWPDDSVKGAPVVWAVIGGDTGTSGPEYPTYWVILVGPASDVTYSLVVTGTTRIPTLYQYATQANAGVNSTFISAYLPDLLIMASMIYLSGAQRDFGRASDDPQMAVSYESQYQTLLEGAKRENYRARWQGAAWSSASQPPAATPNR